MAKIVVSLQDELLRRIDRAASDHALPRSLLIARTLARSLDVVDPIPGSRTTARAALSRIDRVFARNLEPAEDVPDAFQEDWEV